MDIAKMCLYLLSVTLLLLSSTENSFVTPLPAGESSCVLLVILVSKYEEISVPAVNDLILVSDKVYTGREVLDMEKLMAKYFAIQFLFANSIRVYEEVSQSCKKLRVMASSSTMDENGNVRSTYQGFESEAAMKETLDKYGSKPRSIISVEGYDTCLPEEDIKSELTNHFNSCGEVFNVIVRKDPHSPNLD
ncbi:hypothetical protein DY000_02064062, partial [Brassica cretica]